MHHHHWFRSTSSRCTNAYLSRSPILYLSDNSHHPKRVCRLGKSVKGFNRVGQQLFFGFAIDLFTKALVYLDTEGFRQKGVAGTKVFFECGGGRGERLGLLFFDLSANLPLRPHVFALVLPCRLLPFDFAARPPLVCALALSASLEVCGRVTCARLKPIRWPRAWIHVLVGSTRILTYVALSSE